MKFSFLTCFFLFVSITICTGQKPDTLIKKLDSLSIKSEKQGGQVNNTERQAYNPATKIKFGTYFILLGSDLKQGFTKPFHMTKGDWLKFGGFAVGTGAVMLIDEPIQKYAVKLSQRNRAVKNVSSQITKFGGLYEAYTLGALGAYGYIFNNSKMQTTTLLATQAYLTGGAMESVLKLLSGRQRPFITDSSRVEAEPTFYGPFHKTLKGTNGKRINSSFPSGHTTVAFAAATVYAMEYKDRPWVPIVAYTAATAIGLSRITENKHWITDVVSGAALGYLSGRLVVNNYHRYAKLKSPQDNKGTVGFNIQYNYGTVMPGIVYTFR
jgi:membrane-associated phospholipid phosphatase